MQASVGMAACALLAALVLAGCASWTPRAQVGDEVTLLATFDTPDGDVGRVRIEAIAGWESPYGEDFAEALIGAQEGDVIRTQAILVTRRDHVGPYPIEEAEFDAPRASLVALLQQQGRATPPEVGERFDAGPKIPFPLELVRQNATTVVLRVVPVAGHEVSWYGGHFVTHIDGNEYTRELTMEEGQVMNIADEYIPEFAWVSGTYVTLDNHDGMTRLVRLEQPRAGCTPQGPRVISPDVVFVEGGETAKVTMVSCMPGTTAWSWTTAEPAVTYDARGDTISLPTTKVTERKIVRFDATATSGDQTANASAYVIILLEGESEVPVTVEATVLRVDRPDAALEGGPVGEGSSVRRDR